MVEFAKRVSAPTPRHHPTSVCSALECSKAMSASFLRVDSPIRRCFAHFAPSILTFSEPRGRDSVSNVGGLPGSPLPQFGTPQICHSSSPHTASHDPQNSGVIPEYIGFL